MKEFINKKGYYIIDIDIVNGTYWLEDLEKIINLKIKPQSVKKNEIEISWDFSEYEFDIEKDNIKFTINLNDDTFCYIKLINNITEENKQKLREWATIIAQEVEKLKQ